MSHAWRHTRVARGWQAPPELGLGIPARPRVELVNAHSIDVNPLWWATALRAVGLEDEQPLSEDGRISRAALFSLGREATDPKAARLLLWTTLSWGTGRRQRLNRRRIAAVVEDLPRSSRLLADAAHASRESARAGLAILQPDRRPLLHYLGPSFTTKFLYFAGGGALEHPCVILDAVVAARLRSLVDPRFPYRYGWDPVVYGDYCAAMAAEAQRLSTPTRPVAADELEVQLFRGEEGHDGAAAVA